MLHACMALCIVQMCDTLIHFILFIVALMGRANLITSTVLSLPFVMPFITLTLIMSIFPSDVFGALNICCDNLWKKSTSFRTNVERLLFG